jgi:GlpG protein
LIAELDDTNSTAAIKPSPTDSFSIMRQAGTLSNRDQAQRLVDYLLTQNITAKVDADGQQWAIWVRDEDQLSAAVRELDEFLRDPQAPRYQQASQAADALRRQQDREDRQRQKNFIEMRNRWDMRAAGRRPLTWLLIAVCVLVALATELGENHDSPVLNYLWFAAPPGANLLEQISWTPTKSINAGEVWRLVTPIFIHFGPMHLLFNMYMFYIFGSVIEIRRGTLRFGLLVLSIAIAANYGQYYFPYRLHWGGPPTIFFGGMSGVVYGLFGYVWMKSRFEPQLQMFVPSSTVVILVAWLVLGWTGVLDQLIGGSVANWEHTIGLLVGIVVGYAPVAWRQLAGK